MSLRTFSSCGAFRRKNARYYLIWEEGKAPDLVIELTSKSTKREDQSKKRDLYRDVLRVPEYFLFDPTEDYLKPPLQGFRLVGDEYIRIEPVDGRLPSEILGLHLERDGQELRLYDPETRSRLPTPREREDASKREAEMAKREAETAKREAETAKREAETAEAASGGRDHSTRASSPPRMKNSSGSSKRSAETLGLGSMNYRRCIRASALPAIAPAVPGCARARRFAYFRIRDQRRCSEHERRGLEPHAHAGCAGDRRQNRSPGASAAAADRAAQGRLAGDCAR